MDVATAFDAVPEVVLDLCRALELAGMRPFIVGGTARDLLLGRVPVDFDVAVPADPGRVARAFVASSSGFVHEADPRAERHGTTRLRRGDRVIEVTSFRADGPYTDHRRPDTVRFIEDIDVDATRRDFSVNAIYLDAIRRTVVDPCGGLSDLATRRLRVIGDTERRLGEDPLRVLRALRFAATHDLVFDAEADRAIRAVASQVAFVPKTRARRELELMLTAKGRARAVMLLAKTGVGAVILPGLAELGGVPQPPQYHPEGDVLRHTALVLACLVEPVDVRLAWTALFHDFGKRETFEVAADRIRFNGHDLVSARHAEAWLREYGASRALVEDVVSLIEEHIRIASVPDFRPARRERFLRDPLFGLHMAFHRADCLASHGMLDRYEDLQKLAAAMAPDPLEPLLSGKDLLAQGFEAGPAIGVLLRAVEEARAERQIQTPDEALRYAMNFASRHSIPCRSTPKG